ncbi:DNA dC-_dU-editing enzyme APOBEC-3G-like isoform X3 [Myotis lucifugus]|uniref:DNA dC->dU-editing enzyme APOBEC-3G-like isoform X3 n=1 Tax=Myotis lucifugus TaxID=59463 RepID=UPI000CCC1DA2|nr:DNA dC->dU-editing enzyme APOBEC-3G-like isoform X3 [Myotis lucifugus]
MSGLSLGKGWGAAEPAQQVPHALLTYKAPQSLKASQEEDSLWLEEKMKELRHGGQPSTNWQVLRHAELCFLHGVRSWHLDEGKQYRLTWHISWSPCPDCASKLVEFLGENSHVSLRIFAARIHTKYRGYEDGLRQLQDAVDHLTIMTLKELQHCWVTFVDNQGQPFEPEIELLENIGAQCQKLESILRNQGN